LPCEDPADQPAIDKVMLDLDGTENKTNLGANAILGRKGGENHRNIWGKGKACFILGRSHAMMKDWGGFNTNSL
jgi:hypothetical protein